MFALLVWCLCGYGCYKIAEVKGYEPMAWALLGILFGVFALLVILLIPNKK